MTNVETLAQQVVRFMRENGATRIDEDTVEHYLTVCELAEANGFYIGDWPLVKEQILRNGYAILFTPGKGHYLGYKGEEAANIIYTHRMATGWENRTRRYFRALNTDGGSRAEYVRKKFGDNYSWEDMERRYGDGS